MPSDYSSMFLKLRRAEELLNRINLEVDAWHSTSPYEFITAPNEDHTCYTTIVKIERQPDIVRWSLIFSDFIHNLRCVLDHMVWAIAIQKDPTLATSNETGLAYPIWDDPPNSGARKKITLLKGTLAYEAILFMQPHNWPSPVYYPYHPLSILRDLDNTNKHKLLHLAMPRIADFRYQVIANRATDEGNPKYGVNKGQVEDGAEIMKLWFDRPHPETRINFNLAVTISITHKKVSIAGKDRDDYAALGEVLIDEVMSVFGAVAATVS